MTRLVRSALCIVVLTFLSTGALAQRSTPTRSTNAQVVIRVTFDNEHSAGQQIRVELVNATGMSVAQTFTDEDGRAQFHVGEAGAYQVRVTGMNIQESSESFQIDDMDRSRVVYVRVKPKSEQVDSAKSSGGKAPLTSAAELRVPNDAKKAFRKGLEAWQQNDFAKAAEYFEKATAIYPEYDTAFNNLGVMYAHLGEQEKAEAAFQRSVKLNDKNADADRNLARILLKEKQFPQAQDLLRKSLVVEPLNPVSLTLLAVAEIEGGNLDAALEDARKAHSVPHDGYALSHYLAGQVLEQKQQYQSASMEYQTYLRETPNGPESPEVKSALDRLTANGSSPRANAQ